MLIASLPVTATPATAPAADAGIMFKPTGN
jgi:hypothetical protein